MKPALTGIRIAECMLDHPLASYRMIGVILAHQDGRRMPYGQEAIGKHYRAWAKKMDKALDMPRPIS